MGAILTQDRMAVKYGMDLVQLKFGDRSILLYYHTVFDICMKIRGLATFALRHERKPPQLIRELEKYEREPLTEPLSPIYRRSGLATNVNTWDVTYEGQLVVLHFNEQKFKMHYADAAVLHAWLGRAAKEAKRWAGDNSRQWRVFAKLTDAEDNDKFAFG